MKPVCLLLAVSFCALMVHETTGWWWGRRCRCSVRCDSGSRCNSRCCKRGLTLRGREEETSNVNDIEVPYPADFSVYDANRDLIITLKEFKDAVLSHIDLNNPENLNEVFMRADANGDGQLDEDEFLTAPWNFADDDEIQKLTDLI